ncbi:MAG: hypothetical protein F6K19_20930 [Cyanothece sp. SIO1E1]|nr:hypothetical protein [Cyanothece sp. SIO1E1]
MARDIRLNYIYANEATWERFDLACDQLGWASKSLVQQCIHAFFKKNRTFYAEAAIKDAEAREVNEVDYYRILRDETEEDLPRYTKGRPGFGITPLDDVPFVEADQVKRRYNVITLSNYNFVLLRVARIIDTGPMIQLASRILQQHFGTYWTTNYQPQIKCDQTCSFH